MQRLERARQNTRAVGHDILDAAILAIMRAAKSEPPVLATDDSDESAEDDEAEDDEAEDEDEDEDEDEARACRA